MHDILVYYAVLTSGTNETLINSFREYAHWHVLNIKSWNGDCLLSQLTKLIHNGVSNDSLKSAIGFPARPLSWATEILSTIQLNQLLSFLRRAHTITQ